MLPPRPTSSQPRFISHPAHFANTQDVLSDEALAFQLLDVATVLLTYCGPKAAEKGESSAVIVDLIATLGFYCANNPTNQVSVVENR